MAYQPVDIGSAPNDGTGDPIRDAFDKCNDNFVELYAGLTGLLDFKGSTDCSANPNYPAASKGDFYVVSVAGKIGGASGTTVEVGDAYFAEADNAGGTQAAVGTDWSVIQANIVGSTIAELDDIPDVNAPTPADGDVLTWDATPGEWVAAAPTGGSNALDDLTDVDAPTPADGDVLTYDSGSGDWVPAAPTGGGSGGLIGRQIITATGAGTYTPTGGTNSVIIELIGGGGGGAGIASPTASNASRGQSGGGGGYVMKRLTANFSGAGYVVGAKGTGGPSGANNGNNGSDTTFTDTAGSPTVYTAGGGPGGSAVAATATLPNTSGITAGGTATNGDINIPGANADISFALSTTIAFSGKGGASPKGFSMGAVPARVSGANTTAAGVNAAGYGGGGAAGAAVGTGSAQAGGNGSDGIIIIWEYS